MKPSILAIALFTLSGASLEAQTQASGILGFYRSPVIHGETRGRGIQSGHFT